MLFSNHHQTIIPVYDTATTLHEQQRKIEEEEDETYPHVVQGVSYSPPKLLSQRKTTAERYARAAAIVACAGLFVCATVAGSIMLFSRTIEIHHTAPAHQEILFATPQPLYPYTSPTTILIQPPPSAFSPPPPPPLPLLPLVQQQPVFVPRAPRQRV